MNRRRNPVAFFIGMVMFFMGMWFTMLCLWESFTGTSALEVLSLAILSLLPNGYAYWGFRIAAEGFSD